MRVITDAEEALPVLDQLLGTDPVAYTLAGTMINGLGHDPSHCLVVIAADGIAARSSDHTPVAIWGSWRPVALDEAAQVIRSEPALTVLNGDPEPVQGLADRLGAHGLRTPMRLYRLDVLARPTAAGTGRPAEVADRSLLITWFERFCIDSHVPTPDAARWADTALAGERKLWLWLDPDGLPASMAAHSTPQHGSARIGPVYTPDDARGHGYASAVTALVTAEIQAVDAVPVLFTDLGNPVSNSIYQKLGYYPVRDYLEIQLS